MEIYNKIKQACDEQGISISELEQKAGVANGIIGKWRVSTPNLSYLTRVAHALGVHVRDLIED